MNQIVPVRNWRFGHTDRIVFDKRTFRYVGKKQGTHILQWVRGDFMEDDYLLLSDRQVSEHIQHGRLSFEKDHFSRQVRMLRARFDTSRIDDLDPVARMQLLWRYEWVRRTRELVAMNGNHGAPDIIRNADGFGKAIMHLGVRMQDWFADAFRSLIPDLRTKDYPAVPAGSTLYDWVTKFENAGCRIEGLRDGRSRSGRKDQLHADVLAIVVEEVEGYRTPMRPSKAEIVRRVHERISTLNAETGSSHAMTSARIVRGHIDRLDPFLTDAARLGVDKAVQRHAGVGVGVVVDRLFQRIEMDDWEFDLQVLECSVEAYENATPRERRRIPRIRPTATVAIDAYSRTIVGFHLSPYAPSSAGSIACLRSVVTDKAIQAVEAGCRLDEADEIAFVRWCRIQTELGEPIPLERPETSRDIGWSMFGRPEKIVTDGGPAFDSAFDDVGRAIGSDRSIPEKDPRLRGRIERFFQTLQGAILHFFSGRTFSNSVERGDYDAERQASLTFEELRRFCIRYIVDVYHRSPHEALGGRSPANFWMDAMAEDWKGMTAFATPAEMRYAFAVRHTRKPTREGVRLMNLHYQSPDIERFRGALHGAKISCRVDPFDLNSILVDVPEDLRTHADYRDGLGFVVVPVVGDLPEAMKDDPSLENWVGLNGWLREVAKLEDEEQLPLRIAARQDLYTGGRDAMERAGVLKTHDMTDGMFERFQKHLDRKRQAAHANPATSEKTDASPEGRTIAETGPKANAGSGAKAKSGRKRGTRPATTTAAPAMPRKAPNYRPVFDPDGDDDVNDIETE